MMMPLMPRAFYLSARYAAAMRLRYAAAMPVLIDYSPLRAIACSAAPPLFAAMLDAAAAVDADYAIH